MVAVELSATFFCNEGWHMQELLNPLSPQWAKAHQKPMALYNFLHEAFLTTILEYLFPKMPEIQNVGQKLRKDLQYK